MASRAALKLLKCSTMCVFWNASRLRMMLRVVEVLSKSTTPAGRLFGNPLLINVVKNMKQKIGAISMQNMYMGLPAIRLNSRIEICIRRLWIVIGIIGLFFNDGRHSGTEILDRLYRLCFDFEGL